MILGFDEAKTVDGRFIEFSYLVCVKRNQMSKGFRCFQDNDLEIYEYEDSKFFHNEADAIHVLDSFNGHHYDIYSYRYMGRVSRMSYTAEEVVALRYQRNDFKYLSHLLTSGSIDYIS